MKRISLLAILLCILSIQVAFAANWIPAYSSDTVRCYLDSDNAHYDIENGATVGYVYELTLFNRGNMSNALRELEADNVNIHGFMYLNHKISYLKFYFYANDFNQYMSVLSDTYMDTTNRIIRSDDYLNPNGNQSAIQYIRKNTPLNIKRIEPESIGYYEYPIALAIINSKINNIPLKRQPQVQL